MTLSRLCLCLLSSVSSPPPSPPHARPPLPETARRADEAKRPRGPVPKGFLIQERLRSKSQLSKGDPRRGGPAESAAQLQLFASRPFFFLPSSRAARLPLMRPTYLVPTTGWHGKVHFSVPVWVVKQAGFLRQLSMYRHVWVGKSVPRGWQDG